MKVLLLGASGSLGGYVIEELLRVDGVNLRLYARGIKKLEKFKSDSTELMQGDAEDEARLVEALSGVNAVYAGLAGSLEMMASTLVSAMKKSGVKRVVWITSYGIYAGEVPSGARPKLIHKLSQDHRKLRP